MLNSVFQTVDDDLKAAREAKLERKVARLRKQRGGGNGGGAGGMGDDKVCVGVWKMGGGISQD